MNITDSTFSVGESLLLFWGTFRTICGTLIGSFGVSALWMTFTIFFGISRMTRSLQTHTSTISSNEIKNCFVKVWKALRSTGGMPRWRASSAKKIRPGLISDGNRASKMLPEAQKPAFDFGTSHAFVQFQDLLMRQDATESGIC